jgi:hypothetical protein
MLFRSLNNIKTTKIFKGSLTLQNNNSFSSELKNDEKKLNIPYGQSFLRNQSN